MTVNKDKRCFFCSNSFLSFSLRSGAPTGRPTVRRAAAARRTRLSRAARSPASDAFAATAVCLRVDQSGLRRWDSATATTTVAATATTRIERESLK